MREYFIVSLCKNGILGGGITAGSEAITYHTGKLTVPDKYKHIEMKYRDILALKTGRLFVFPTVTLEMNSGEKFRFIVFARKRFVDFLKEQTTIYP
ncbi:MAG: hypothetical protein IJ306_06985 [Oscillospiraceae bacterium]|nr:hypothetical protein [Oscillospiraceae bacterium]